MGDGASFTNTFIRLPETTILYVVPSDLPERRPRFILRKDHLDGYLVELNAYREPLKDSTLADVASRTKAAGSAVVPTMAIWNNVNGNSSLEALRRYPELRFMPAQTVADWTNLFKKVSLAKFETPEPVPRIQQRILKALHDRGVTILFGTDSPHIFNVPVLLHPSRNAADARSWIDAV